MKPLSIIAIAISILFSSQAMQAASVADLAKAQAIIHKINELVEKYREMTIELEAPKSMANSNGKYVLPFNDDGELTGWANKALEAQAGAAVGEKAGSAVGKALATKVPLGGFMAGSAKKKGKQVGAATAMGGMKFIKESSNRSLNKVDDYIVYLHVVHGSNPDYQKGMASAMALYPEMEGRADFAKKNAYKQAAKAAKKKK